MKTKITADEYLVHSFGLGLQYLVVGRYGAASHFMPVSANLLHHAVEMFLKGCLVREVGFEGLPRGRAGHNLNDLWSAIQKIHKDQNLDRFTQVISDLHKFEHIRYPENMILDGALIGVGFPSGAKHSQIKGPKVPEYQVSVEDVDMLVRSLFELGNVYPEFFTHILSQEHAKIYYEFRNNNPLTNEA